MRSNPHGRESCRGFLFPDQSNLCVRELNRLHFDSFAGGEEGRYFALLNDAQGGGPGGDQSSRGGGVVPKHKVAGKLVSRVDSSRWFPGEFVREQVWPVAKTTVTSP